MEGFDPALLDEIQNYLARVKTDELLLERAASEIERLDAEIDRLRAELQRLVDAVDRSKSQPGLVQMLCVLLPARDRAKKVVGRGSV